MDKWATNSQSWLSARQGGMKVRGRDLREQFGNWFGNMRSSSRSFMRSRFPAAVHAVHSSRNVCSALDSLQFLASNNIEEYMYLR